MNDNRTIFEILWYSGGPDYAPNRCIGRTFIKRHDLTGAIRRACKLMETGKGGSDYASGFYVRKASAEKISQYDGNPPITR